MSTDMNGVGSENERDGRFQAFAKEVASEFGFDPSKELMMVRCATASMIFKDDHPEWLKVRRILQADESLRNATAEFLRKLSSVGY